jgi:serine/arginine repetitive matrix protein 2
MTTKSRNTPLDRLSRVGLALGIGPTQATRDKNSKREDDSYIPYNGPYEAPAKGRQIRGYWDSSAQDAALEAHSFSHLSFGQEKTPISYSQKSSFSNGRKYLDASGVSLSNIMTEPRRRFSRIRQNSTPPLRTSYVSLDQGGGVGDTPVPVHRSTPSQSGSSKVSSQPPLVWPHAYTPFQRRDLLFRASVTDLRKSFSRSDDKHEKTRPFGTSTDDLVLRTLSPVSGYEQTPGHSRSNSAAVRQQHPYATASPQLGQPSSTQTNSGSKKSDHHVKSSKKVPAHLKPSSRASLLKASVSTPDLRSASRQPAMYVKTKTHWLSAETWCDAFVFPRPRFLLRHLEEGSVTPKRRLVSPAESTISETMDPSTGPKPLRKSQSISELRISKPSKETPTRVDRGGTPRSPPAARPRSFALDDLALPSPTPSLITCVLTPKLVNQSH